MFMCLIMMVQYQRVTPLPGPVMGQQGGPGYHLQAALKLIVEADYFLLSFSDFHSDSSSLYISQRVNL